MVTVVMLGFFFFLLFFSYNTTQVSRLYRFEGATALSLGFSRVWGR